MSRFIGQGMILLLELRKDGEGFIKGRKGGSSILEKNLLRYEGGGKPINTCPLGTLITISPSPPGKLGDTNKGRGFGSTF